MLSVPFRPARQNSGTCKHKTPNSAESSSFQRKETSSFAKEEGKSVESYGGKGLCSVCHAGSTAAMNIARAEAEEGRTDDLAACADVPLDPVKEGAG